MSSKKLPELYNDKFKLSLAALQSVSDMSGLRMNGKVTHSFGSQKTKRVTLQPLATEELVGLMGESRSSKFITPKARNLEDRLGAFELFGRRKSRRGENSLDSRQMSREQEASAEVGPVPTAANQLEPSTKGLGKGPMVIRVPTKEASLTQSENFGTSLQRSTDPPLIASQTARAFFRKKSSNAVEGSKELYTTRQVVNIPQPGARKKFVLKRSLSHSRTMNSLDPPAQQPLPDSNKEEQITSYKNRFDKKIKGIRLSYDSFKVNSLRDYIEYPLEMFNWTHDPKLDYKYFIKNHATGCSRWVCRDGSILWKPCSIIGYDDKTNLFSIRWTDNGREKQVTRLNLLFQGEDSSELEMNCEEAEEFRCMYLLSKSLREAFISMQSQPEMTIYFPSESAERILKMILQSGERSGGKLSDVAETIRRRLLIDEEEKQEILADIFDEFRVCVMEFFVKYHSRSSLESFISDFWPQQALKQINSSAGSKQIDLLGYTESINEEYLDKSLMKGVAIYDREYMKYEKQVELTKYKRPFKMFNDRLITQFNPHLLLVSKIARDYKIVLPNSV